MTSIVAQKSLFGLGRLRVVAQQFDDAFLLRQRHASLDQTLRSLPEHRPLLRRNPLPGDTRWILAAGHVNLLPQHAVDAAAARRLRAEGVEVVEAENVAKVDQTRSTVPPRRLHVCRRHLGCNFVVG